MSPLQMYRLPRVLLLLAFILLSLSACRDDAPSSAEPARAAQMEPVALTIQMTGLLLILPANQPGKLTHVVSPKTPVEHINWIGFSLPSNDPAICTGGYNNKKKICYVDMNGWELETIGPSAGNSTPPRQLPRGVLNLTRGSSGQPINPATVILNSRSAMTLGAGEVSDSCSLARWTFNPVGADPPERNSLINVLEWQIPILNSESLVLARRNLPGRDIRQELVELRPNDQREIELLILHVPKKERDYFLEPDIPSVDPGPSDPGGDPSRHFQAFYQTIGTRPEVQRVPRRPTSTAEICPITVLDLDGGRSLDFQSGWTPRLGVQRNRRPERDEKFFGVRTYSCMTASAEQT